MARVVEGIRTSHTPTIGNTLDYKRPDHPVRTHIAASSLDHDSMFALGIGDCYKPKNEGGGACP